MRDRQMPVLPSVVVMVLLAVALAVPSAAFAGNVTSSLMVPIDGLVFSPGGGLEDVTLSGRVHLVTQVPSTLMPGDPCRVFVNLADVKGVGVLSGADYIAIGAVNLPFLFPDPPPIFPQFVIMPVAFPTPPPITPPDPIMPITFEVGLAFDATGHLTTQVTDESPGTFVTLPPGGGIVTDQP